MSSLYDKYYSGTNINHVYDILVNIISKEKNINLKDNSNNIELFKKRMDTIFKNTKSFQLEDVNKQLLIDTIQFFMDKTNNQPENIIDNSSFNDEQFDIISPIIISILYHV